LQNLFRGCEQKCLTFLSQNSYWNYIYHSNSVQQDVMIFFLPIKKKPRPIQRRCLLPKNILIAQYIILFVTCFDSHSPSFPIQMQVSAYTSEKQN